VYDLLEINSGSTGIEQYLLFNKEKFKMNASFKWRYCDPYKNAEQISTGPNIRRTLSLTKKILIYEIRDALYEQKITDLNDLNSDKFNMSLQQKAKENLSPYGICLDKDDSLNRYISLSIVAN